MVRKIKIKQTSRVKKHPRSSNRGWSVLRRRWLKLFKDFKKVSVATWRYAQLSRYLGHFYLFIGFLLIGIWATHWWGVAQQERVSRAALIANQLAVPKIQDKPHPTHIYIQWFVDAPIEDGTLVGNTWTLPTKAAIYLIQSARPATPGNIIIYGHNTREMMGNIRALKGYETITLTLSDGTTRKYKVNGMHQVTPTSVTYIQPTSSEVLTLFTCAGFADLERFVVTALPIE